MHRMQVSFVVAAACLGPRLVAGQEALTLEAALERARTHALAIVEARYAVDEARARIAGARALRDNPALEAGLGLRSDDAPDDYVLGVSQAFELGGRRGARTRVAQAGLERAQALQSDARTRTLRGVGIAFLRALAAGERLALARALEKDGESVARIAERRHAAGDVARLDVNLADGSLARARSAAAAEAAGRALALGELRVLLALPPEAELALAGEIGPRTLRELAFLVDAAARRGDVLAAEAALREARAELEAANGQRWPEITPAVRYERDEGTNVLWGGLSLSLPVWSRGQEARGAATARSARAAEQLAALQRAARVEVESAFEAQRLRLEALAVLREAASRFEENEALARRSYEVGQIGLAELLLVRRETLDARLAYLERRLDAAEGEIELLARAGVLQ